MVLENLDIHKCRKKKLYLYLSRVEKKSIHYELKVLKL